MDTDAGDACDGALVDRVSCRLRMGRLMRGLRLKDLAGIAGCSTSSLSRIEVGNTLPTVPSLLRITAALGVSVSWVTDDDGPLPTLHHTGIWPAPAGVERERSARAAAASDPNPIAIGALVVKGGAGGGRLLPRGGESMFAVTEGVLRIHRGASSVCAFAEHSFHLRSPEAYSFSNGSPADLAVTVFSRLRIPGAPRPVAA